MASKHGRPRVYTHTRTFVIEEYSKESRRRTHCFEMSGWEDESAMLGQSTAAKQVQDSAVRTTKKLEKEHQTLLHLRSLVDQQLRVLQVCNLESDQ